MGFHRMLLAHQAAFLESLNVTAHMDGHTVLNHLASVAGVEAWLSSCVGPTSHSGCLLRCLPDDGPSTGHSHPVTRSPRPLSGSPECRCQHDFQELRYSVAESSELLALGLTLVPHELAPAMPAAGRSDQTHLRNRTRVVIGLTLLARVSGCFHALSFADDLWAHGPNLTSGHVHRNYNLNHRGSHGGPLPKAWPAGLRSDATPTHLASALLLSSFLRTAPEVERARALYRIEDRASGWGLQFREAIEVCSGGSPSLVHPYDAGSCAPRLLHVNATLTLEVPITFASDPSIWGWSKLHPMAKSGHLLWLVLPPDGESFIKSGKLVKPAIKTRDGGLAGKTIGTNASWEQKRAALFSPFEVLLLAGQRLTLVGQRYVRAHYHRQTARAKKVRATVSDDERPLGDLPSPWVTVEEAAAYNRTSENLLHNDVFTLYIVQQLAANHRDRERDGNGPN